MLRFLTMKFLTFVLLSIYVFAQPRPAQPPPIQPKPEELQRVKELSDSISERLAKVRASKELMADVAVYEKAGRMLLEFPDEFGTQEGITRAISVLEEGNQRAESLAQGHAPWTKGKKRTHAFVSDLDGSLQPYGVTIPESYDGSKPVRLYVWMHGRAQRLTESEFLYTFPRQNASRPPVADYGQIQLDVYGRWNGAGWHFAGEAEVFEAIAAVSKRYKIDQNRILLRGFSMGGEGAWHIALHHPDRFAAAEIGAGTWSRREENPDLAPYQRAALKIWENMHEWALNIFNLPLAAHDGDTDTQTAVLPGYAPGIPHRGQLESSLRVRDQLMKEGFSMEGDPDFLRASGSPGIFLISRNTGHGTSPLVRGRLDNFLKQWGDSGRMTPNHVRFVTFTTRYNRGHWVTLEELTKMYERAEIDAERSMDGTKIQIKTRNLSRIAVREAARTTSIDIDGRRLMVRPSQSIVLEKSAAAWQVAGPIAGLRKVHGLQGPIDDAFLDPFILVRPTGEPWNKAVHEQSLRTLSRFERLYARFYRAHPRMIDDKDLKVTDLAKYHVVLFGDPGSNSWIAKLNGKLPLEWTKEKLVLNGQAYPASKHFPAMIYPNPMNPSRYVVINTGLTIEDREYRGDYNMPRLGDYAVMKIKDDAEVADAVVAGLFNGLWRFSPAISSRRYPQ